MCLLGQTGNTELIYKAELYTKEEAKKLSGQALYLYLFFFEIKI